jgi:predicted nucleic acid-binding protein
MPQRFLDSSALLKRYRQETGSQWMLALSERSDRLVVARLSHVEVTAAIVRRGREPGNTPEQIANALATFDREMQEIFEVVELGSAVISQAIDLAKARALRAADAIQLACALLSRLGSPASAEFWIVSADEELNAAASAEGLQVENPNLYF